MQNELINYGLAGAVILLVIEKGYSLLRYLIGKSAYEDKKAIQTTDTINDIENRLKDIELKIDQITIQISWIKDVHDEKDADGVYLWYVRRSYEEAVQSLANSVDRLVDHVKKRIK